MLLEPDDLTIISTKSLALRFRTTLPENDPPATLGELVRLT
jgi:hypothetical protein